MHLRTEGMVAAAPVSAELWQSRHSSPAATCCLCENATGCSARSDVASAPKIPIFRTFATLMRQEPITNLGERRWSVFSNTFPVQNDPEGTGGLFSVYIG